MRLTLAASSASRCNSGKPGNGTCLLALLPAGQRVGEIDAGALRIVSPSVARPGFARAIRVAGGRRQMARARSQNQRTRFEGGLFDISRAQGVAIGLQRRVDVLEDFDKIRAGATTRIEHIDILIRQSIRQAQLFAQDGVLHEPPYSARSLAGYTRRQAIYAALDQTRARTAHKKYCTA